MEPVEPHMDIEDHQETEGLRERKARLPERSVGQAAAEVFRGMGEPTRLRILSALLQEPTCVGDLCILLELEQSAVSHQLRLLRELQLVSAERRGRHVVYSLEDDHVRLLIQQGIAHAGHTSAAHSGGVSP